MGTIQPSRFLSHTGRILPGVRRIVKSAVPAPGAGWVFTVPGGVQWWVASSYFTLTTDATAGNRYLGVEVTVDGAFIAGYGPGNPIGPNTFVRCTMTSDIGPSQYASIGIYQTIGILNSYLPPGAVVDFSTIAIAAGDQLSAIVLYVEEVYFTDAQLSEIERTRQELDREVAQYEFQQAEQAQAGA